MTRRAPVVRKINMLSEYQSPDAGHGTQAFFRALSEADQFIHDVEHAAELACRCDELTALVDQIKELHPQERAFTWSDVQACGSCRVVWPCPTIEAIEAGL